MSNASHILRQFRSSNQKAGFPNLSKRLVVDQLTTRVNDPARIGQGGSSLCGAASFLYCLAKKDKAVYAKFIVDLYEKGEAKIGNLKAKPGRDCRNYRLPTKSRMADADWIGLASLRDSANMVMDYQDYTNQAAGITAPDTVEDWFQDSGFHQVTNRTSIVQPRTLYDLLQAHRKFKEGANVCLLISSGGLAAPDLLVSHVDHWIVMNSPVRIDGKPVTSLISLGRLVNEDEDLHKKSLNFQVYTWGKERRNVKTLSGKPLTVGGFLKHFYGFVSAK